MNIEKLQKMNELAKELKSHGLAQSMDDAYSQADNMVNDGTYVQIRNVMDLNNPITNSIVEERRANNQVIELHEKIITQNSKLDQMNSVVMKMQEVMNDLISEVVKLKEHKSITTGVNSVIKPGTTSYSQTESMSEPSRQAAEVQAFEQVSASVPAVEIAVQRAASAPSSSYAQAPDASQLRNVESQVQSQSAAPQAQRRGMYAEKQDDANHPRQGSYTPMDVSIEKFFNVNKR